MNYRQLVAVCLTGCSLLGCGESRKPKPLPHSNHQNLETSGKMQARLVDASALGMHYHDPTQFNKAVAGQNGLPDLITVNGTVRRVWPNRALPIYDDSFYQEDELHVVELWSDSAYFDRVGE